MRGLGTPNSLIAALWALSITTHPVRAADAKRDAALHALLQGKEQRLEIAAVRAAGGELKLLLEVIGLPVGNARNQRLVRLVTTEPDGTRRQSEWLEGVPRQMTIFRFKPAQKEWVHTEPVRTAKRRPWPTRNAEELRRAYSSHLEASEFASMELVEITDKGESHVLHKRGKDGRFAAVKKFLVKDEGVE